MRDRGCGGLEANRKRYPRQQREGGNEGPSGIRHMHIMQTLTYSFGWFFYHQEER